jgi:hypothetical protein
MEDNLFNQYNFNCYILNFFLTKSEPENKVLIRIAKIIIHPPSTEYGVGTSPYPIKTQTGFSTGSIIAIIDASTA